jgi:hypothetical protein
MTGVVGCKRVIALASRGLARAANHSKDLVVTRRVAWS